MFNQSDNRQSNLDKLQEDFEDNNCRDLFIQGLRPENVTEPCKGILKSISMFSFDGFADECKCDPIGSLSSENDCDPYTGQCPCKKNVAGRQCQLCAIGSYGLGVDGCRRKFALSFTSHFFKTLAML